MTTLPLTAPLEPPPESDTVVLRVAGQQVRVTIRRGDHSGTDRSRPALLLCNGIGASLEIFDSLVDALQPDVDVIRFDVPGAGDSPAPKLPYSFAGMAYLVAALIDRLGYRRVDVLGFSWGGGLAQQFAAQYPHRCRRLVLANTSTGVLTIPGRPQALVKMLTPHRYHDPAYAARIAPALYGGSMRQHPDDAPRLLGRHNVALRGYLYQLGALVSWTSLPYLGLLKQQTLLLCGDDDPIIPLANGRIMNALLPRSKLHIFPGGHLEILNRPSDFAPVIDDFLNRA